MSDIHVMPINDLHGHLDSPECPCRPVLVDGVWVHRSFDGREFDEDGHTLTLPSPTAETALLLAYWMHWITRSCAIECLRCTPQAFEVRLERWLERLPVEYKAVEEILRPGDIFPSEVSDGM